METALLLLLLLRVSQSSAGSRASVIVSPKKSQFNEYDKVTVSCEQSGSGSGEWTVWRYTSLEEYSQCGSGWGSLSSSVCIIETVKKSDSGVYWCESKHRDSSNVVNISVSGEMMYLDNPVVEGEPATLTLSPNSCQMFEYMNVSLSCGLQGWRVARAVNTNPPGKTLNRQICGDKWGTTTESGCILQTAKKPDTGIYWCESPARQRSNSVSINVFDPNVDVILWCPAVPVTTGDSVTLSCKITNSLSHPAVFYKDGVSNGTEPIETMTIDQVSKSDEGSYECLAMINHSSKRSSPCQLLVKDREHPPQSYTDPVQSVMTVIHYLKFALYVVPSARMLSYLLQRSPGRRRAVSKTKSPPADDDDDRLDPQYDDVIAGVTTEHSF